MCIQGIERDPLINLAPLVVFEFLDPVRLLLIVIIVSGVRSHAGFIR